MAKKNDTTSPVATEATEYAPVLTNRAVYSIYNNFKILNNLQGFVVVREANRNYILCENYRRALNATIEPSDEYKKGYLRELEGVQLEFADRDADGHIQADEKGNSIISIRVVEYRNRILELQKKYEKDHEAHEAKVKEFNAHLDDPAPLNLYKFSEGQIAPNVSMEQYGLLIYMVDFSKGSTYLDEPKAKK